MREQTEQTAPTPRDLAPACTLNRADLHALLYALDDADGLFMGGERADRMLAMWQRLNVERCDGASTFALSDADALNLWLLCTPDWLRTVTPASTRERVTAIINRCRPSTRLTERATA